MDAIDDEERGYFRGLVVAHTFREVPKMTVRTFYRIFGGITPTPFEETNGLIKEQTIEVTDCPVCSSDSTLLKIRGQDVLHHVRDARQYRSKKYLKATISYDRSQIVQDYIDTRIVSP
ncbi:hypothetical protein PsorP6_014483 [Peronosclerospora sorghi]|uniref:Uncharacterized protein n=1 Tax=Peronosclerospora sorghi TaxID=230839 RepID=A0ACC0VUB1_9STRA|nr:hypothetical protein PsorP6_014483 [Peronosclerospora sorghi]